MVRSTLPANPFRRSVPLLLGALAVAVLAGCRDDEIRRYKVPQPVTTPMRLLGAIVPHGERTWFFKLLGPAPAVGEQKETFDRFLATVKFVDAGERPITWKVPDGWSEEPGSQMRYATLKSEGKDHLELTVTTLGRDGGAVLPNVDRWRGQLGLAPVAEAELASFSRELTVGGEKATVIDLTGTGADTSAMTAPAPAAPPMVDREPARSGGLKYVAPAGWTERPATNGFARATFAVTDGGQTAEVTVTPLGGMAGGLLANVNRWRNQVGLGPTTEEQLSKDQKQLDVAGTPCPYFDLAGPKGDRILAVSMPQGGQTWFLKMKGPAELVGRQQANFEAFAKSVRFE
jgi:hypothetical protein